MAAGNTPRTIPPSPETLRAASGATPAPAALVKAAAWQRIGWAALLFSALQALCPAVLAVSGLRVAIGLGALASAAGTTAAPRGLHVDWIRVPMMALAALGAALNLFVVWQLRRLRARPAAQWRLTPPSASKLRGERLQVGLSLFTFALLVAEWLTHPMVHLPRH